MVVCMSDTPDDRFVVEWVALQESGLCRRMITRGRPVPEHRRHRRPTYPERARRTRSGARCTPNRTRRTLSGARRTLSGARRAENSRGSHRIPPRWSWSSMVVLAGPIGGPRGPAQTLGRPWVGSLATPGEGRKAQWGENFDQCSLVPARSDSAQGTQLAPRGGSREVGVQLPACPRAIAARKLCAFSSVSSVSRQGSLSITMPPPAKYATVSR